jgi:predicted deacylase
MAAQRLSPLDGGNLNRAFPGDPDGGPTAQISFYIANHLIPLASAYHDLHAGGRSLDYLTYCGMHLTANEELNQKQFGLVKAFGPPFSIVGRSSDDRLAQRGAHVRGIPAMGGEFGGRAAVTTSGVALVERGIRNTLAHLGILKDWTIQPPPKPTRFMQIVGRDYFVYAMADGLFQPAVELGDWVEKGQLAGRLHFVEDPMRPPLEARFARTGLVVCKRAQGRAERGDCVAHLATDFEG